MSNVYHLVRKKPLMYQVSETVVALLSFMWFDKSCNNEHTSKYMIYTIAWKNFTCTMLNGFLKCFTAVFERNVLKAQNPFRDIKSILSLRFR